MARPGNVVNTINDLKAIGVGIAPFEDGFNIIVKDPIGDGSILPLQYIWLNRASSNNGLKVIKPNNNNGGWYLMQILGDQLPAIDASTLSGQGANYYRDRANHTGTQPANTIAGLGNAALLNIGNAAGTVAAGDDARFGQATNALSLDGHSSSYFLNRANHTGNIALASLDLLTGYSVGSAVAINATDSILSAFGKAQAQLNNKPELVGGLIPSSMLPSYVDDVLEYANLAAFPVTGESGKLYIAIDTNLVYRWTGSTYAGTSSALALGETSTTAYRGDRGKVAYDHSLLTTGNPHSVTKIDVGLSNLTNNLQLIKANDLSDLNNRQTALNNIVGTQAANRLLRSDGTNVTLSQVVLNTDISGVLPVANGGSGTNTATGSGNLVLANSPSVTTLTNTGNFIVTGASGSPPGVSQSLAQFWIGSDGTAYTTWICAGAAAGNKSVELGLSTSGEFYLRRLNDTYTAATNIFTVDTSARLLVSTGLSIGGGSIALKLLSAVVTWDIPNTGTNSVSSADFTVTGAAINDFCQVTALSDSWFTLGYNGFLSASVVSSNTVRLRWHCPPATVDPTSATFRILVMGF